MDRYAVIGNPVAHSRSPRIHALFARQTGQALRYEKLLAPLDGFAGAVRRFQAAGGRGANVTLPFKLEALALCDESHVRAQRAGAVNTLTFAADGRILGDNTDGAGLLRDLTVNLGLSLGGLRILLLGAGGAVRGVLQPLLECSPAQLCIANRTATKALALAEEFGGTPVEGGGYADLEGRQFDLIINGTSSGLADTVPPLPEDVLMPGGICYDMLYGDAPTPFLHWAMAHGAGVTADGLGMLVEQAAESFLIWRGLRPETLPVLKQLRAAP
jgi:shikimate dehydrogenase